MKAVMVWKHSTFESLEADAVRLAEILGRVERREVNVVKKLCVGEKELPFGIMSFFFLSLSIRYID